MTTRPRQGRAGQPLVIACASASSNPPSDVSWLKDGNEIIGIDKGQVNSDYGGWSTRSELELIPTEADDGEIYACQAMNELIARAVSDAVTLDILCE